MKHIVPNKAVALLCLLSFAISGCNGAANSVPLTAATNAKSAVGKLAIGNAAQNDAAGPSRLSSFAVAASAASLSARTTAAEMEPLEQRRAMTRGPLPPQTELLPAQQTSVIDPDASPRGIRPASLTGGKIVTRFNGVSAIDYSAASDGNYVVTADEYANITILSMSGVQAAFSGGRNFFCSGTPAPAGCGISNSNSYDGRVEYDPGGKRWIVTALFAGTGPQNGQLGPPGQDLIAVSETSDPRGAYYIYQFPACGPTDTWDKSDQPKTGFNSQWIVVVSSCGPNPYVSPTPICTNAVHGQANCGDGVAVFDKANIYAGKSLTLSKNWFDFYALFGPNNIGNPVSTYGTAPSNREYITVPLIDTSGNVDEVYSYVSGSVDSPTLNLSTKTVTTTVNIGGGDDTLSDPVCTHCVVTDDSWLTHSSGLYNLPNGHAWILATASVPDINNAPSSQIVNFALDLSNTTKPVVLYLEGGTPGAGPLASAITASILPPNGSADEAMFTYVKSSPSFIPGVSYALWDLDTNTTQYINVLQQGTVAPPAGSDAANRWIDFDDAAAPVPGSARVWVGGNVAIPTAQGESTTDGYYPAQQSTVEGLIAP